MKEWKVTKIVAHGTGVYVEFETDAGEWCSQAFGGKSYENAKRGIEEKLNHLNNESFVVETTAAKLRIEYGLPSPKVSEDVSVLA